MPKPKKRSPAKRRLRSSKRRPPKRRPFDIQRDVPAYQHGTQLGPKRKTDANVDGEGTWIYLRRFEYDRTLRGRLWDECCNCGKEHLWTFAVIAQPGGEWWLVKRAYGNPSKPGRKVVRSQRRRLRST